MSTLTLRPNGTETYEQVTNNSGATVNNYQRIDEETLSESDYCVIHSYNNAGGTATDIYSFPDHSAESGTINSVTVKAYATYVKIGTISGTPTINPSVKISSTVYASGAQNLTTSTALYSYGWTTNPATSAAWSWTEIDNLLAGDTLYIAGVTSKENYFNGNCYQLWVEVDYTAGGGSPVFLPNIMKHNFIPPLIGGY